MIGKKLKRKKKLLNSMLNK